MNCIFEEEYKHYKTIVVANGEVPEGDVPLSFLRGAERIVCCDGAVEKLLQIGFVPTAIVGDCDSISEELYDRFKDIVVVDGCTEYNDLQKSLKYCRSNNYNSIAVLGSNGLREDHNLANLAILDMYAADMDLLMVGNMGIFSFITDSHTFASYPNQAISIFSLDSQAIFTFKGLKYPVSHRQFKHLWEGSLNAALGDSFTIEIEGGRGIIYRCYQ